MIKTDSLTSEEKIRYLRQTVLSEIGEAGQLNLKNATRETFTDAESETLLRGFLSPQLFERGLICRADDRGDPVIQISPPLVAGQQEFDQMVSILGDVLAEASTRVRK